MTNTELETCINKYGRDIYSFCRHLACNVQEADDLYQDTFLTAIEREDMLNSEGNPKSYLLSIALRIWKNRKRKFAWRKRIVEEKVLAEEEQKQSPCAPDNSPEHHLLKKEEHASVREAVERLPERLKVIVLLYYMEEVSVAGIAEIVKIPPGTVKSRLYQARKLLEKELEDV